MTQKLLPRYPGAKNPAKYKFWDGGRYDAVVEPFAGSGVFGLWMLQRGVNHLFLADADPTITSIYQTWLNHSLHQRYYECLQYRLDAMRSNPATHWQALVTAFERTDDSDPAYFAAASIVCRELTFGGVIRFNSKGKMTAPMVADRIEFLKRQSLNRYRLPPVPRFGFIGKSWQESFTALVESGCQNAICLIDPPYFSPTCKDASYRGHKGQDLSTLNLCVDAVKVALSTPQIKRIIICNYYSEQLATALREVAGDRISSQYFTGSLTQMQRGKICTTQNRECIWEIGTPAVKQLDLFCMSTSI